MSEEALKEVIVRMAANHIIECGSSEWLSALRSFLLSQADLLRLNIDISDFGSVTCSRPEQHLYVYQLFKNVDHILKQLEPITDFSLLERLGFCDLGIINTTYLKQISGNIVHQLANESTFPDLQKEWLSLCSALDGALSGMKIISIKGERLEFDNLEQKFMSKKKTLVPWYDISYMEISTKPANYEIIKIAQKLCTTEHTHWIHIYSLYDM